MIEGGLDTSGRLQLNRLEGDAIARRREGEASILPVDCNEKIKDFMFMQCIVQQKVKLSKILQNWERKERRKEKKKVSSLNGTSYTPGVNCQRYQDNSH